MAAHTRIPGKNFPVALAVALISSLAYAQPAKEERSGAAMPDGASSRVPALPEVMMLRSDERQLTFEYRPRFSALRSLREGGQEFTLQDFEGSVARYKEGEPGTPDVRYRSFAVAFPSESGNSVHILAADYEDIPNVILSPVPRFALREGMLDPLPFSIKAEAYASSDFLPAKIVESTLPGQVRSLLVGNVRVYPVQYNPATRTLRRYSRLVVQVLFGPARAGGSAFTDDPLLRGAVLNPNILTVSAQSAARNRVAAPVPSVLASGDWYRITVSDDGLYKIDSRFLSAAGVALAGVDPRTIRIYGNGGTEVPEDNARPRISDLAENAISIEGEADGSFDASDYILFYGRSPRGWDYDAAGKTFRHRIHHYTVVNYYWLTFGGARGKRMSQIASLSAPPSSVVETFTERVFVEEEKVNLLSSGKDWYGQSVNGPSGSFTHVNLLPDLVPGGTIAYRYNLVSHSDGPVTFTVRENGSVIGSHFLSATYGYLYATADIFESSGPSTLPGNSSQLNFAYSAPSAAAQGWIDWVEILYPRRLWGENNTLRFRGPDNGGTVEYRLQQFASMPMVFDVTAHDDVKLITGVEGSYAFRAAETPGRVSEYCAGVPASWKAPAGIQKMANQDLHGYRDGADFIIVTSEEFRATAERLKAFREQPAHGGLKTIIADVGRIANEFSGGLPDVAGIRDFLKFAYDNWTPRPQFVLFLGGASFDYKGILGAKSSYAPTWQSLESRDEISSYSTDDFFAKFGASDNLSLVLGRISARTVAEADVVVDKIIRYEESSSRDAWKMRVLFIGDDAYTTEGGEVGDRTLHSDDAEALATSFTPDEFEKRKIYIAEYPTVNTTQGRRKSSANQAIVDQVNQGVLIFNYTGHGRADLLAHEHIFEVQTNVPQLTNASKLAVWFLATCGFSQFDDPKTYTGSEVLINKPDGGAVGVVSATRKVYAGANAALNQGTFRRMFTRDAYGRLQVERPATALFMYKAASGNIDNDQKFCYMGDPTMRLQYPASYATIDSINGQPVDSVGGVPRGSPLLVSSLSRVTVSGTVRGAANQVDASFNGRVSVIMNDATRKQVIVNFYPGTNWEYMATGGTIYRGDNSVTNGRFTATFIVPKDIAYADSTARARLVAYLSGATADGSAYTGNVRVGGTDTTVQNDGKGPEITIALNSRGFRPGDLVSENPILYVDLRDSNGINTSGSGIGHRIEGWVNNALQSSDLTEYYSSKLDEYREGTVQYQLADLPSGRNSLKVRAWDSFNNSSVGETFFTVAASDQLTLADVMNYPNPFNSNTAFTFRQNQNVPLSVTVKIYTLAGRVIQVLDWATAGEPYVHLPWDGRDRDGDVLANGVYLYKVVARTMDGRFSSEALGKLSVLK